jgi:hypothetical protein
MRDQAQTTRQLQLIRRTRVPPGPSSPSRFLDMDRSLRCANNAPGIGWLDDQVLFGGRARKNTRVQVSRARRACLAEAWRTQHTLTNYLSKIFVLA